MTFLRRIASAIRWGATTRPPSTAGSLPVQQARSLGQTTNFVPLYPYGYEASAPADELVLLASPLSNPDSKVGFVGSPGKCPIARLEGEVVLYHPPTGARIHFRSTGGIEITPASGVPVTVYGDLVVTGDVAAATIQTTGLATLHSISATTSIASGTTLSVGTSLTVVGATILGASVTASGTDIGPTHVHSGSPTAPTGAVSNTGAPV